LFDNGIIEHGINFIWIAIVFGSEIRVYRTYSDKDTNEEGLIYQVLNDGELYTYNL
jgi:hypothetical protein